MTDRRRHDEESLGLALRELRDPPGAWIEAAKALPAARAQIDSIVARAEADSEYREQVLQDLEQALLAEGHEPAPQLRASLRARLTELD
jgi:hypothetical protein